MERAGPPPSVTHSVQPDVAEMQGAACRAGVQETIIDSMIETGIETGGRIHLSMASLLMSRGYTMIAGVFRERASLVDRGIWNLPRTCTVDSCEDVFEGEQNDSTCCRCCSQRLFRRFHAVRRGYQAGESGHEGRERREHRDRDHFREEERTGRGHQAGS